MERDVAHGAAPRDATPTKQASAWRWRRACRTRRRRRVCWRVRRLARRPPLTRGRRRAARVSACRGSSSP
jgi:hypothetical protein